MVKEAQPLQNMDMMMMAIGLDLERQFRHAEKKARISEALRARAPHGGFADERRLPFGLWPVATRLQRFWQDWPALLGREGEPYAASGN